MKFLSLRTVYRVFPIIKHSKLWDHALSRPLKIFGWNFHHVVLSSTSIYIPNLGEIEWKMTELSNQKADERKIIIHKRQNKNIKVCRRSRADLNNEEGTAESVKGQRAVAPLNLIKSSNVQTKLKIIKPLYIVTFLFITSLHASRQVWRGGGTVWCTTTPPISVGELYPKKVICVATLFWGPMVDKITHLLLSRETVSATTPAALHPLSKIFLDSLICNLVLKHPPPKTTFFAVVHVQYRYIKQSCTTVHKGRLL